ncbi:MAG: hypothetical protein LBR61_11665 [Synergistaceae bacterium]|jgi:hypothetical protein|nr:hypothetical protein [Synergistaceae bacterium]
MMERRIVGVMRWLERCLKACRAGSLENALMDMECARADLEHLRDEVWTALEGKNRGKGCGEFFARFGRVTLAALAIVLLTGTPLAQLQENSASQSLPSLPPLPMEGSLLSTLSAGTAPAFSIEKASIEKAEEKAEKAEKTEEQARKKTPETTSEAVSAITEKRGTTPRKTGTERNGPDKNRTKEEVFVSYERILSLVQTGERALKNERPVIPIER